MKISPIGYNPFIGKVQVEKNQNTPVPSFSCVSCPIEKTQISNIYYQPVNFSAKNERTYQSDKPKLKERSGDFQVCKFSDVHCPATTAKKTNPVIMSILMVISRPKVKYCRNMPTSNPLYRSRHSPGTALKEVKNAKAYRCLVSHL